MAKRELEDTEDVLEGIVTASDLLDMHFPPLKWIVPDLLTEGHFLLAGAPKIGKSWLVLQIGMAVAGGSATLGGECFEGAVLYLALEDNLRRLQSRIIKQGRGSRIPNNLSFHTSWPRASDGGIQCIQEWIDTTENPKLVIIDVLAKFQDVRSGKANAYTQDHEDTSMITALANDNNICVVTVHHTNKGKDGQETNEKISGTLGLNGGVDGLIVVAPDKNGHIVLHAEGRDIPQISFGMALNKDSGKWEKTEAAESADLSGDQLKILRSMSGGEPMSPDQISVLTELKASSVSTLLARLALKQRVTKASRGKWALSQ